MHLLTINEETLRQAAEVVRRGGLVAFPTETVYGLGGDAFNPSALARIFEAKNRPRFDPLIVHIAAAETLETIADLSALDKPVREKLAVVISRLWPGPLTVILPKQKAVPDLATSGLPTVAARLPAHDAARRLIALSTGAIAAPSANPFGYLSPTKAQHVAEALGDKADIILDGGATQVGLESTVLDMCSGQPRILRPGGTSKEVIEALIGEVASGSAAGGNSSDDHGALSPGMLPSHYAPRIPLTAHDIQTLLDIPGDGACAFIFFDGASRDAWIAGRRERQAAAIVTLSETGDLPEAAAKLFAVLHDAQIPGVKQIHAQLAPERGLGIAINDRLRRAAAKRS